MDSLADTDLDKYLDHHHEMLIGLAVEETTQLVGSPVLVICLLLISYWVKP